MILELNIAIMRTMTRAIHAMGDADRNAGMSHE